MPTAALSVEGMTCASCVAHVDRAARLPGVRSVRVNLAAGRAEVEVAELGIAERVAEAIRAAGFGAEVDDAADRSAGAQRHRQRQLRHANGWRNRALIGLALWAPTETLHWVAHFAGYHAAWMPWLMFAVGTAALVLIGSAFYRNAFAALRRGTTDMDVLIAMGASVAYGYSVAALVLDLPHMYFTEAAGLLALISLGHWLEARARLKAGDAIGQLLRLTPDHAHRLDQAGNGTDVPVHELARGDTVLVRPGQRVPADGVVTGGRGGVDESLVTGESVPTLRAPGEPVLGGTLATDGALTVRLTRVGAETALANIVRLVEHAQASKPPVQRLADRISAVFVPIVLGIALVTGVVWVSVGYANGWAPGVTWGRTANAVCSVLIIACPCALGLAIPAALMVGTGLGARRGILLRDVDALQRAEKLGTVVLDKTGTLTKGKPAVVDIHLSGDQRELSAEAPVGRRSKDDLLTLAASAERFSAHPLAEAIVAEARRRELTLTTPDGFEDVPGLGVRAVIGGHDILVGSAALLREAGIDVPDTDTTAVHVARKGVHLGHVELADPIKPDTPGAIAKLHAMGLRTVLLTGDHQAVAERIAAEAGIEDVRAEVRPDGKAAVIEQLKQTHPVAMVGDGVNDAPALAAADLGIALRSGADVATEAGGVVLMHGSLLGVPRAVRLSRATMRCIRQNLFFAFVYNVAAIPLAAVGLLNPLIAAACMALSDLCVIGNALRLRRRDLDR
ncbi:MAG: heavy metal translocating P-type ATPase [Planctomycetota bacterium]